MNDFVWVTIDVENGSRIIYAGSRDKAMRVAGVLVGNNSYAGPMGDIYLYGPGDGSTSVMVRQLPRKSVRDEDAYARIGYDMLCALRAVQASLSNGEDGCWRAGPWADPSTEEGEGGTVEMIRGALLKAEENGL